MNISNKTTGGFLYKYICFIKNNYPIAEIISPVYKEKGVTSATMYLLFTYTRLVSTKVPSIHFIA